VELITHGRRSVVLFTKHPGRRGELPAPQRGINCVRHARTKMIDNPRTSTILLAILLSAACCVALPGFALAQAPPGPLPQSQSSQDVPPPAAKPQVQKPPVQPRTSIFGAWKLDRDDSDDPRKKCRNRAAARATAAMAATAVWAAATQAEAIRGRRWRAQDGIAGRERRGPPENARTLQSIEYADRRRSQERC